MSATTEFFLATQKDLPTRMKVMVAIGLMGSARGIVPPAATPCPPDGICGQMLDVPFRWDKIRSSSREQALTWDDLANSMPLTVTVIVLGNSLALGIKSTAPSFCEKNRGGNDI
jgi:hypothetical protein